MSCLFGDIERKCNRKVSIADFYELCFRAEVKFSSKFLRNFCYKIKLVVNRLLDIAYGHVPGSFRFTKNLFKSCIRKNINFRF